MLAPRSKKDSRWFSKPGVVSRTIVKDGVCHVHHIHFVPVAPQRNMEDHASSYSAVAEDVSNVVPATICDARTATPRVTQPSHSEQMVPLRSNFDVLNRRRPPAMRFSRTPRGKACRTLELNAGAAGEMLPVARWGRLF
mmetsp:Transcript_2690/g.4187  ORF Transcript_2690/g.4187 Transcript_2690/m.4187 type:complete len:139 (-) Transcript_2690:170-586(-)